MSEGQGTKSTSAIGSMQALMERSNMNGQNQTTHMNYVRNSFGGSVNQQQLNPSMQMMQNQNRMNNQF